MPTRSPVTEEDIKLGLGIVAKLIDEFGEAYWPIFDRLERELEIRQKRCARLRNRLKQQRQPSTLGVTNRGQKGVHSED